VIGGGQQRRAWAGCREQQAPGITAVRCTHGSSTRRRFGERFLSRGADESGEPLAGGTDRGEAVRVLVVNLVGRVGLVGPTWND
jgi:hypothetical protein